MDFKSWIMHFKNVDRPIGDLANDISKDDMFPIENDFEIIRDYLEKRAGFEIRNAILETFDSAWAYYLKDRP